MRAGTNAAGRGRRWCGPALLAGLLALAGCDGGEKAAGAAPGIVGAGPAAAEQPLLALFGSGDGAPALVEADRRQLRAAERRAFAADDGRVLHWQNPGTGTFGEIVPVGRPQRRQGQVCREFRHKVLVDGRSHQAAGTACSAEPRPAAQRVGTDAGQQG